MKKIAVVLFGFALFVPNLSFAATSNDQQILALIQSLLNQIKVLQARLDEMQSASTTTFSAPANEVGSTTLQIAQYDYATKNSQFQAGAKALRDHHCTTDTRLMNVPQPLECTTLQSNQLFLGNELRALKTKITTLTALQ